MLNLEGFTPNPTAERTGRESLVERWVLDRLNQAADSINKSLEARNFMNATISAHQFWLYELCDIYIEAMKPMMDPSASAETRNSAQNTLYTCLDHGLRLLQPFMPYVTEELWQRLPRRPNDTTPSIMLCPFPVFQAQQQDQEAETQFDTVFAIVKAVRSLAGKYGLTSNLQSFIQSAGLAQQLEGEKHTIASLAKGSSSVQVVSSNSDVPSGCVSEVVSRDVVVHLLVKVRFSSCAQAKLTCE
jgi:valyl-tRNA synthetase